MGCGEAASRLSANAVPAAFRVKRARSGTALACSSHRHLNKGHTMGKYLIGWLLGIPAIVLVILYLFFH
jgi:hypothetical protein